MVTKNKKKNTKEYLDNSLIGENNLIYLTNFGSASPAWTTNTYIVDDASSITFSIDSVSTALTDNIISFGEDNWSTTIFNDPYFELEKLCQEQEDDEKLRKEYPCLQEAYDNYLLIKKLLQDEECDKYFEDKMRVFKK